MKLLTRRMKSARGAELIEFALVFPLLLLVVLGIVDFGFLFQRMEVVTNAAREGARIAVLPGYELTDVKARACSYLASGGVVDGTTCPTPANTTISCSGCTDAGVTTPFSIDMGAGITPLQGVKVTVTYQSSYLFLSPIMSWFGGSLSSVPITGTAVMRYETPSS
jgi:Flp pilus assembly protein TadG